MDADGNLLTDLLRWDSTIPSPAADALFDRLGCGHLFAATGVQASPKVPLAT